MWTVSPPLEVPKFLFLWRGSLNLVKGFRVYLLALRLPVFTVWFESLLGPDRYWPRDFSLVFFSHFLFEMCASLVLSFLVVLIWIYADLKIRLSVPLACRRLHFAVPLNRVFFVTRVVVGVFEVNPWLPLVDELFVGPLSPVVMDVLFLEFTFNP